MSSDDRTYLGSLLRVNLTQRRLDREEVALTLAGISSRIPWSSVP